ncbi:LysR family transcriptional regulator [Moritella sp. 24]|uniref:LysR family transcriptional regulator n=1 Tax=Moritella sp. 24 TaxID=2746230 RepID=UPI001BABB65F|nr:LysR family transcriptional regulator [Moritella sp. 24]QUM75568.1 LysR family transcriptional regulator [Moritella sp. 24]
MNNYKLLPALISILQTRNLTESARQLNVTQSAMSKTLQQIRTAFHDKIVIREANQFVLTHKGEELKLQLPTLMQTLDNLYLPNTMDANLCRRQFTLASSDYVAQAILPSICWDLANHAPNASIEYQLWHKDNLTELADMPLDLVSTITDMVPENLHGKSIGEDKLVVVCRDSHPLYQRKRDSNTLSLVDYVNAKHILISGGGDKDSPVDHALTVLGKKRQVFASVPFFQSAIELLLKTDTLLTTPLHIAADFAQTHDLQIMTLPVDIKPQQYYLLWHAKHHHDPEHTWFRECCYPFLKNHLARTKEFGMKLLHADK